MVSPSVTFATNPTSFEDVREGDAKEEFREETKVPVFLLFEGAWDEHAGRSASEAIKKSWATGLLIMSAIIVQIV